MADDGGPSCVQLRDFLAGRDVPCPVCRYNLRGCDGAACPECGARLDLRVGSIDLRLGPWLLCVLALAVPMGFSGICGLAALNGWRQSTLWSGRDYLIMGGLWALTIACGVALLVISKRRARFLRRSRAAQWTRAWVTVVVSAAIQVGAYWLLFVAI